MRVVCKQVVLMWVQHLLIAHCKAEVPAPEGHDGIGHERLPHDRLQTKEGVGKAGVEGMEDVKQLSMQEIYITHVSNLARSNTACWLDQTQELVVFQRNGWPTAQHAAACTARKHMILEDQYKQSTAECSARHGLSRHRAYAGAVLTWQGSRVVAHSATARVAATLPKGAASSMKAMVQIHDTNNSSVTMATALR